MLPCGVDNGSIVSWDAAICERLNVDTYRGYLIVEDGLFGRHLMLLSGKGSEKERVGKR